MNNHSELKRMMGTLADIQSGIEFHKDTIAMIEQELADNPLVVRMNGIRDQIKEMELEAANLRKEIEPEAVKIYTVTGEKQLAPGLGIRVYKTLDYDMGRAVEYCVQENMIEALQVDKKVFEKYAKAMEEIKPLDFITYGEEPKITISSDLKTYLYSEA